MRLIKEKEVEFNLGQYSIKEYDENGNLINYSYSYGNTEYIRDNNGRILKEITNSKGDYGDIGGIYESNYSYNKNGYIETYSQTHRIDDSSTTNILGTTISSEEYHKLYYTEEEQIISITVFSKTENYSTKKTSNIIENTIELEECFYDSVNGNLVRKNIEFTGIKRNSESHYYKNNQLVKKEYYTDENDKRNVFGIDEFIYNEKNKLVEKIHYREYFSKLYPTFRNYITYENGSVFEETIGYENSWGQEKNITKEELEQNKLKLENKDSYVYDTRLELFDEKNNLKERIESTPYGPERHIYINDYLEGRFLTKTVCVKIETDSFKKVLEREYFYEKE